MPKENFELYDRISSIVLSSTILLSLLAFIPGGMLSGPTLKGYILVVGVSLSLIFWIIGRLMEGRISLPRTGILPAVGILLFVFLLSALFSPSPYLSFFGEGLDQGAFVQIAALTFALFLGSVLFPDKRRLGLFLRNAFVLYVVLALYQLVHLFLPAFTSFGIFLTKVSTPAGTWADFAVLSGAALVGAVLAFHFTSLDRRSRIVAISGAVLALFFMILANVLLAWILVGLAMLGILAHVLLSSRSLEGERVPFPFLPFAGAMLCIFFIITSGTFGYKLADVLHAPYLSASPSPSATLGVISDSLKDKPILGAGLNRFSHEWSVHRPQAVNMNVLWNTQFSSGTSLLFTEAMLAGVLGILALFAFLFIYFGQGIVIAFRPYPENTDRSQGTQVFSILLLSLYFLFSILLSSPGISITAPAFFFIGLFIASATAAGRVGARSIEIRGTRRSTILTVTLSLIFFALLVFVFLAATRRVSAQGYFSRAVQAANAGDPVKADAYLLKAIAVADLPSFERTRVSVAEQILAKLVAQFPNGQDFSADAKEQAVEAVQSANTAALKAIELDPFDTQNYLLYGDLMKGLLPFKAPKAFENGRGAYEKAIELAPDHPLPYFALAELYADAGDMANAKKYVEEALVKKPNYTEAYILLSRISAADGDAKGAMAALDEARSYDPKDANIYAEIGYLGYRIGDYEGAVTAFRMATGLGIDTVNVWYYLAQSLAKMGDKKGAATILSTLHVRLPDDAAISKALSELSSQ